MAPVCAEPVQLSRINDNRELLQIFKCRVVILLYRLPPNAIETSLLCYSTWKYREQNWIYSLFLFCANWTNLVRTRNRNHVFSFRPTNDYSSIALNKRISQSVFLPFSLHGLKITFKHETCCHCMVLNSMSTFIFIYVLSLVLNNFTHKYTIH